MAAILHWAQCMNSLALVMRYGDIQLVHSGLGNSLLPDRTNVDQYSVRSFGNHLRAVSQKMLEISIIDMSLKITNSTLKRPGFWSHAKGHPGPERPRSFHIYIFVTTKWILLIMFDLTNTRPKMNNTRNMGRNWLLIFHKINKSNVGL